MLLSSLQSFNNNFFLLIILKRMAVNVKTIDVINLLCNIHCWSKKCDNKHHPPYLFTIYPKTF